MCPVSFPSVVWIPLNCIPIRWASDVDMIAADVVDFACSTIVDHEKVGEQDVAVANDVSTVIEINLIAVCQHQMEIHDELDVEVLPYCFDGGSVVLVSYRKRVHVHTCSASRAPHPPWNDATILSDALPRKFVGSVENDVRDVHPVIEVQFDGIPSNKLVIHWHVSEVAGGSTDMRHRLGVPVVDVPRRWDEDAFFITCFCVVGCK